MMFLFCIRLLNAHTRQTRLQPCREKGGADSVILPLPLGNSPGDFSQSADDEQLVVIGFLCQPMERNILDGK